MKYIKWTKEMLDEYLSDKFKRRGVDSREYDTLCKFIRKMKPKTIIDVGCFFGVSTYILGTSSPNLEYLYAIENIDSPDFVPYIRNGIPIPKEEYGMFHPEGTIFKTHGFEKDLASILQKHPNSFVFLDAVKLTSRVFNELQICYENKAKYVAMHDVSKFYKQPRLAMKKSIKLGWFKLLEEHFIEGEISAESGKNKGIAILELV